MAKVINIIGSGSNVGKTYVMEGLIKELKSRGLSIATIKHDVHGFDIDKEGKDTYKHRKAGSETVIISSKNRLAMIKELKEETDLQDIIKPKEKLIAIASDTDIHMDDVKVIPKEDFKALADLIEKEEELKI